jgi:hypothetical protein
VALDGDVIHAMDGANIFDGTKL